MWHQWFNRNFTKLREYFLCAKKTKIMTLFNNYSPLNHFIIESTITHAHCFPLHVNKAKWMRVLRQQWLMWFGGEELWNKVVIFIFFAHKRYSRSFVKLRLNHWCHMDCFTNVLLTTFVGLGTFSYIAVYAESESSRISTKYLNLCSEDEQRSYGFVTTRGRVINDRIFIFGWTIPLMRLFRIWISVGDAVTSLHRWVMAAWRLFPSAVRTGERTHAERTASRERPSIPHAYSSKVTP